MALIKCPECGSEISDRAASCPRCGYPINNSNNSGTPPGWKSCVLTIVFHIAIGSGHYFNTLVTQYMSGVTGSLSKATDVIKFKDIRYGDIIRQPIWYEQRVTIMVDCAADPPFTNSNVWFKPKFGGGFNIEESSF